MLKVGADARTITPDLERHTVFLAGFEPDRLGTSIHDDLWVRSVAFAGGDGPPVVLSVCDLIGITRRTDPLPDAVVACTHTHHGPDAVGLWGRPFEGVSGIDEAYLGYVQAQVTASRQAAIEALEPAVLRVGSVDVEELVENFRDPDVLDPELTVWRAQRPDGSTIATICSYGCHPEVVAADNHEVTADFAGHLCRLLDSSTGGIGVFAAGDLGGMQAPRTEARDHAESERFGRVLAAAAELALESATTVDVNGPDDVVLRRRTITVPLDNPMYALAMNASMSSV
jgi:hypothetical protein